MNSKNVLTKPQLSLQTSSGEEEPKDAAAIMAEVMDNYKEKFVA